MGRVSPNPVVGAVITRGGDVLGEGWHEVYGGPHAEVNAIAACDGADLAGATLYVSLEPCCHQGHQPPCTDAILEAGIGRVVVAGDDPSSQAAGRGLGILRDEGVLVDVAGGELAQRARQQNQAFRKHVRTGRPLVIFKSAMSLDGKVATQAGDSKWISTESSRALAHRWRASLDAVAVGIGTALSDDPQLTARIEGVHEQPRRVVFDSTARLPLTSRLVADAPEVPLVVVVSRAAPRGATDALETAGAEVVVATGQNEPARVRSALDLLGALDPPVTGMLLEGGPHLAGSFLDAGRDRRAAPVHRAAAARRPHRPRPAGGRGRRARGRCDPRAGPRVPVERGRRAAHRAAAGVVAGTRCSPAWSQISARSPPSTPPTTACA